MASTRRAAVAGMFYPADPEELRGAVQEYLGEAEQTAPSLKALIAPHAGYIYSGPIAGTAFAQIPPCGEGRRRVPILCLGHRLAFAGLAAPSADRFETPLGEVTVDSALLDSIADLPQVEIIDDAHTLEHGIEVQLPFLQYLLPSFSIAPLLVGSAEPEEVCEVLDTVWGGDETLIVISSDLSHYHDYTTAQRFDRETTSAIEGLRDTDIRPEQACGHLAIKGLLQSARKHGLTARNLDLRNSGDTAGPKDRVVGYGAYAFTS